VSAFAIAVAATIAATLGLLFAEAHESRGGVWICKPLAAAGFLAAALANGALESGYGTWIFAGLLLSALGDVLLIPKGAKTFFLAGLVSFLLGHLAYAGAFALRGLELRSAAAAAGPVAGASMIALRYLWPHVQARAPQLQIPVLVYVAVISTMVVCAAASIGKVWNPWILPGAVAFYASDLAVARQRFVAETFSNKVWGTPLYFGAQLLLAASVAPNPP
jgi:uncharacterized membrane protein YhhN